MTSFSKNSVYFYPDISCNTVVVSRFTLPIITVQITTYLYVVFIVEKFILKFHFSKIYFDNNLMINCRKKYYDISTQKVIYDIQVQYM